MVYSQSKSALLFVILFSKTKHLTSQSLFYRCLYSSWHSDSIFVVSKIFLWGGGWAVKKIPASIFLIPKGPCPYLLYSLQPGLYVVLDVWHVSRSLPLLRSTVVFQVFGSVKFCSWLSIYALRIQLSSITHLLGKEGSKVMIENNFLERTL